MKHLAAHIKENISVEDLLHKVGAGNKCDYYNIFKCLSHRL